METNIIDDPIDYTDEEIIEARHKLWYMSNLQWKLSPPQKRMYREWVKFNETTIDADTKETKTRGKTYVINAGRRVGKSFILSILAIEQCLRKPKSVVKFLQPEKNQVRTTILPLIDQILEDCPQDLRPSYKTQDSKFVFSNGSQIHFGGTDGKGYNKLRGSEAHLCLIDEAAFLNESLSVIIRSVLAPATMRVNGKIIISSSSPTDPNHEFLKYCESARVKNNFFEVTTKECLLEHMAVGDLRFTKDMYNALVEEYPAGERDEEFRRECLNEVVAKSSSLVIPEFTAEVQEQTIREWKRPVFCDKYVSMDIGFKDLTAVLFGFYDFDYDLIVIEDEISINGPEMTTDKLASLIKAKEAELWTDNLTRELMDPFLRVCDNNNLILINDLHRLHGVTFLPSAKDNKEAQINDLRIKLANFQIYIHPRCKNLIYHVRSAMWENTRSGSRKLGRAPDGSHYDFLDSLIYFVRNVRYGNNPYPQGYSRGFLGADHHGIHVRHKEKEDNSALAAIKKMFSGPKKPVYYKKKA